MKKIIFLLSVLFVTEVFALTITNNVAGHVRLIWSYDTNSEPATTNTSFNVYSTTNLNIPFTNWLVLTNINALDALGTNNLGLDTNGLPLFYLDLWIIPQSEFFVMNSSNFWGFSGITGAWVHVPPMPQNINNSVRLQKIPPFPQP